MTTNKSDISFKSIMDSSIEESIEESYANYGGTNALGTVQGSSQKKYSPASVLKADPLRHKNPDITMGQSEFETKSPSPMLYPFESVFVELVEIYTRVESIQRTMHGAKDMATLTDAKQKVVSDASDELERIVGRLHKIINNIEEVTV